MSRILGVLLAVVLVFGIAFAYSGFDIEAGTGTIGIGQVDHPTQGDAPLELVATKTTTKRVQWTCTRGTQGDSNYDQNLWTATSEKVDVATAPAKLNPKDMVLNYTFGGWVEGEFVVTENDHIFDPQLYLDCNTGAGYVFAQVTDEVTYGPVTFSY